MKSGTSDALKGSGEGFGHLGALDDISGWGHFRAPDDICGVERHILGKVDFALVRVPNGRRGTHIHRASDVGDLDTLPE